MLARPSFSVRRFDQLDSTNRYLIDQARQGAPAGLVALADYQSAGRGRMGRRWEAPPASALLASILLRLDVEAPALYFGSVAVALSAADACQQICGVNPGLKWPNDLVVEDRKLAGVMAEVVPDDQAGGSPTGGSAALVVGIGLNLSWSGPPEVEGVGLVEASGHEVDRDELLDHLLSALKERITMIETAPGRASLASELSSRCVTLGRAVRVDLSAPGGDVGNAVIGRATAIGAYGELVVVTEEGVIHEVFAGDVVHLRDA